jgi:hypothetical protein
MITLEELKDKYFGKPGTTERDNFEMFNKELHKISVKETLTVVPDVDYGGSPYPGLRYKSDDVSMVGVKGQNFGITQVWNWTKVFCEDESITDPLLQREWFCENILEYTK